MTQTLYLIRGLPGSGKSTLAARLTRLAFSADDYFLEHDGIYRYRPTLISMAHEDCQTRTRAALHAGHPVVAVANTFSRAWELQPYWDMAGSVPHLEIVELTVWGRLTDEELAARCKHGVPAAKIAEMRARWEP